MATRVTSTKTTKPSKRAHATSKPKSNGTPTKPEAERDESPVGVPPEEYRSMRAERTRLEQTRITLTALELSELIGSDAESCDPYHLFRGVIQQLADTLDVAGVLADYEASVVFGDNTAAVCHAAARRARVANKVISRLGGKPDDQGGES